MLAIDKIGCGFTDNPPTDADYVIGSVVQHGIDFLAALGIERAHLVGHSRGGYAVARIALERPDLALLARDRQQLHADGPTERAV